MKHMFILCLALGTAIATSAQKLSDFIEPLYPKVPFNAGEAAIQLDSGSCTIKGTAFAKTTEKAPINLSKRHYVPKGSVVILFPYGSYLQEWYKMVNDKKRWNNVAITPEAYSYRIVTKVIDDDGHFEFTNMKPGKYYITTQVEYTQEYTEQYVVGETNTYKGNQLINSTPIYQFESFTANISKTLHEIVDVSAKEKETSVKLRKRIL